MSSWLSPRLIFCHNFSNICNLRIYKKESNFVFHGEGPRLSALFPEKCSNFSSSVHEAQGKVIANRVSKSRRDALFLEIYTVKNIFFKWNYLDKTIDGGLIRQNSRNLNVKCGTVYTFLYSTGIFANFFVNSVARSWDIWGAVEKTSLKFSVWKSARATTQYTLGC